jgi:hypothetical protein
LIRDDLADQVGVQARTVKHWENGRSGVPADVATTVQAIYAKATSAASESMALIAGAQHEPGDEVLTRFRCSDDFLRYRPDMRGVPAGAQAAIVARVMLGLKLAQAESVRVRVVCFDANAFETWRTVHKQPNTKAICAAWAAQVLSGQATPTAPASRRTNTLNTGPQSQR